MINTNHTIEPTTYYYTIKKLSESDKLWFGSSYLIRVNNYGWFPTEKLMGVNTNGRYWDEYGIGANITGNMGTMTIGVENIEKAKELLEI